MDNLLTTGPSNEVIMKHSSDLNEKFIITNLGELKCYLGINVRRNKAGDFLVSQTQDQAYLTLYRLKLIRSLLYLSVNRKSDITTPVAILSQQRYEIAGLERNSTRNTLF